MGEDFSMSNGTNEDELREIVEAYGTLPDRNVDPKKRLEQLEAIQIRLGELPAGTEGLEAAKDQVASDVIETRRKLTP